MFGRFIIWVEDAAGNVTRAFTWTGRADDGIARARAEERAMGKKAVDIWATPANIANETMNWSH
jgi:hypothetical protein